ncbi:MAG: hypothetical protein AAFV95_13660 [Bacteroidota bacterium]
MRPLAFLFSVVFHPLIIPTYMLIILLLVNPYLFGVNELWDSRLLILIVFVSTFFIPAFCVFMMKVLELIPDLQLEDRQDRIIPYIATGVFYLWLFWNLYNNNDIPVAFRNCMLGATIALFMAFFINLFSKISVHAVGMGGLVGMIVITTALFSYGSFTIPGSPFGGLELSMGLLLIIALLTSGIVCTSRLILNAHNLQDLYGGFLVGMVSQFLALQFLT